MNVEIRPQYLVPQSVASTRFCPMEEKNSRELRNASFKLIMCRYSTAILREIVRSASVGRTSYRHELSIVHGSRGPSCLTSR